MTERSTQTEIIDLWENYETLQPNRSLGTSPIRCCDASPNDFRKRSRSNSRSFKKKTEGTQKREYLMRPFGVSDEEYNGIYQKKDPDAHSASSYTPEDRNSWAPLTLNATTKITQPAFETNGQHYLTHLKPTKAAREFAESCISSSIKDLAEFRKSNTESNDVSSYRRSEKSEEPISNLLHCSNCGAFSAKSLDELHASQFGNQESLGYDEDLVEFDRKYATERHSRSTQRGHDAQLEQYDLLETYSHDGATRRRSRSRHRNKHVHISSDVISINNENYRVAKPGSMSERSSYTSRLLPPINFHPAPIAMDSSAKVFAHSKMTTFSNGHPKSSVTDNAILQRLSRSSLADSTPQRSSLVVPPQIDVNTAFVRTESNSCIDDSGPSSSLTTDSREESLASTGSSEKFMSSLLSRPSSSILIDCETRTVVHGDRVTIPTQTTQPRPSLFPPFWKKVAIGDVVRGMGDLQYNAGANMTDLIFLRSLLENPVMHKIVRAHDKLDPSQQQNSSLSFQNQSGSIRNRSAASSSRPVPSHHDLSGLSASVANDLERLSGYYKDASFLYKLLRCPEFISLASAHDQVAERVYDEQLMLSDALDGLDLDDSNSLQHSNGLQAVPVAVRVVGIRKVPGEPLGVTLRVDEATGSLKVTRILDGGIVDRQELLKIGDVVLELNGLKCEGEYVVLPTGDRQKVSDYLKKFQGDLTFTVQPLFDDEKGYKTQMFMRALFSYNPTKDDLLPSEELGLGFDSGDILEIVESQKDPNWWQARKYSEANSRARLIPSQALEERRAAYTRPDLIDIKKQKYGGLTSKKRKKKEVYSASKNSDFDRLDLTFYEEVAKMPPFPRKTLVLIGPAGVGRRSIKNALIKTYPDNFATPLPTTSRSPRDGEIPGKSYNFVNKADMEDDIRHNRFLEYGEFQGNYYGTRIDSIHSIIDQGKMCVLDCSPQALKILRTSEFMPFVVLIAAPSFERLRDLRGMDTQLNASTNTLSRLSDRDLCKTVDDSKNLEQEFRQYIDLKIENQDPEWTFRSLCDSIAKLSSEPQWVPVSWVY